MTKKRPRRRRRSRLRSLFRRFVVTSVVLVALATAAAGALLYRDIRSSLPPMDTIVDYSPALATEIFADDGTLIGEFYSEKRYVVPIERIPLHVIRAFLAAEDADFYEHKGIDLVSITRAFVNNLAAGGKVQGGSTITQQVVKSLLLTPQKSYERKIKEILLSVQLEQQLSKDEILALYLNHIYLGSSAYGVDAAARQYFDKGITEVSLPEAALLAGLPQAPSRYSPFRQWPRAKKRQRYVLNRMYEAGFISRAERDSAERQSLRLATRKGSFRRAPYFVEHVRRMMEERYGRTGLYELGLRIYTTLNLDQQTAAEEALDTGLKDLTARQKGYRSTIRRMESAERQSYLQLQKMIVGSLEVSGVYDAIVTAVRDGGARVQVGKFTADLVVDPEEPKPLPKLGLNDFVRVRVLDIDGQTPLVTMDDGPPVEGALIAMDPRTGHVKALVGGYDFGRSQFNRAIQAKRQPGSAFKPLIYAAALDRNFKSTSIIVDEPVSYRDNDRIWSPQNFEKKYFGPTTLREALKHSRNVVTVKLANAIGVGYLVKYLQRFGFERKMPRNLSIALGSTEVTPVELAAAYTTFANDGLRAEPVFVTEVTDPNGQVIDQTAPQLRQAIPPKTAYVINSMLQDVVADGTGRSVQGLDQPTCGKTGTTNDLHDAWFVGFTPPLLAVVWVGFDAKRSLGRYETGGRVAAPVWKKFMDKALQGVDRQEYPVPRELECMDARGLQAVAFEGDDLECSTGANPKPIRAGGTQVLGGENTRSKSTLDFLLNDF